MLRSVALLCAAIAVVKALNTELDYDWNSYKKYHNKKYSSEDEVRRRSIWEGHIKLIEKHNREFDMGIHTYTLGTNEYADMTNGEFVSMMNGYRMSNSTSTNPIYRQPSHVGALPDTVDWRKEGYVTEVKNQKQCGSCWAFSTTGSLEGQHFKASGKLVSLSEQNLVDCSSKEGNHGCQGGLMDNAFKYVKSNNGIDTEQSYPYKGHKSLWCHFSQSNIGATLTGYTDVKSGSEQDLMSAVATVGPISVAIDASHSSFQLYKSGVYTEKQCSSTRLDHGVLAVGYGSSSGKNFWLVKNSWGATWGMDGYIMMAKDSNNMCGIATQASYPLV